MFTHVMIGADDLPGAKRFYDATLGVLGASEGSFNERGVLVYRHGGSRFLITVPIDGKPASAANGGTLGFAASSSAQVDRWFAAGLANGGSACEDPPGIRDAPENRTVYVALLRDPTGNKQCAVFEIGSPNSSSGSEVER